MTVAALVSVVLILLILGGLPIFLALGVAGTLGLWLVRGSATLSLAPTSFFGQLSSFEMIALPLFQPGHLGVVEGAGWRGGRPARDRPRYRQAGVTRTVTRAIARLARGLGLLGQLVLLFMVLTICYDVVMRYVLVAPTTWSLEVNTFLIVFLAVLPAADALFADAQLRIGFLAERLPEPAQRGLRVLTGVLGIGFCAIMVWKGGQMSFQALQYDERMSSALGTPMVIPYLFLPVGFAVLGLAFLARLLDPEEGPHEDARAQL